MLTARSTTMEVDVYFDGAPGDISLTLTAPDGTPEGEPECDGDALNSYCFFSVAQPATGAWQLEAEAVNTNLAFSYEAHGFVDEGFTYQAQVESLAGDYVEYPRRGRPRCQRGTQRADRQSWTARLGGRAGRRLQRPDPGR